MINTCDTLNEKKMLKMMHQFIEMVVPINKLLVIINKLYPISNQIPKSCFELFEECALL
jgi:hypothetical protein